MFRRQKQQLRKPEQTSDRQKGVAMTEATSCGGVVIFRGKILVLYKSYRNRYEGWVLPKGTVEAGETFPETALREVHEETGTQPKIVKYVGQSQYTFNVTRDSIRKTVHWYLMEADSYYSKPQREEYLVDSGYYKYHEAYHLLKFSNEKMILETAYRMYQELKRTDQWRPLTEEERRVLGPENPGLMSGHADVGEPHGDHLV